MDFLDTLYGRPNTIQTYTSLFNHHIKPDVSPDECSSWTDSDTVGALRHWERKGLSKQTQTALLRLLSKFVQFNGGEKINTTPFVRTISRSEQMSEIEVLSARQASKLMRTCKLQMPDFYLKLLLGLHGGLRRGEVYGLQSNDIDLLRGKLRIERSYNGPTKNGKTRYIPLSDELINHLTEHVRPGSNDRLFKLEDPNPKLRRLCKLAGLKPITFHGLRHTFATLALEANESPKQVQTWLGHSTLTTTLNIYWGVIKDSEAAMDFLPEG